MTAAYAQLAGSAGVPLAIVGGAIVALLLAYLISFNRLQTAANAVVTARAGIDTELQRRNDLIPNLVDVVKASAAHERSLIEQVTAARLTTLSTSADRQAVVAADASLSALLPQMFAIAEGVPVLRTSESFLALQRELVTTEDRLAAARRYYNFTVRDLNTLVGSAISGAIARRHAIATADYFGDESV